jgi:uncharacterized membrane protein
MRPNAANKYRKEIDTMKKKSVKLFILWGVSSFILVCVYMALMMSQSFGLQLQPWIVGLYLFFMVYSIYMMLLVRKHAKAERVLWLTIVSKALLISYAAFLALWVLIFGLVRLLA